LVSHKHVNLHFHFSTFRTSESKLTINVRIIVGVKYCFRYNQRNRALRNGEDGEPIDLGAMPRAHRRRREKKLMTMDEVNERFPLTKYKAWMTTRAAEGLSTAGGIAATASRPVSVKNEEGVIKDIDGSESVEATSSTPTKSVFTSTDIATSDRQEFQHGSPEIHDATSTRQPDHAPEVTPTDDRPGTAKSVATRTDAVTKTETNEEGEAEDDEDQIQTAVPAEQLPDPGDACAICLDTIEEEDDIRGLTCGHAFHASCVDPWLTSRRACCPLCKADYYIPKPRPEGADAAEQPAGRRARGPNMPAPPQYAFMGAGRIGSNPFSTRRPSMVLPGRFMTIVYNENDRYGFPTVVREPRPSRAERNQVNRASSAAFRADREASNVTANAATNNENQRSGWRQRLTNIRLPYPHRSGGQDQAGRTPDAPSPAQLEAGRA
jgi:hypothetical protein